MFGRIIVLILIFVLMISCNETKNEKLSNETKKLKVVSSTGIITDALQYIAGDKIKIVATICGPGVDPHSYIPTTKDVVNITEADLIFYNGLNLEAKMGDIFSKLANDKAFPIGVAIPIDSLINNSNKSDILDYDPHVWNDPNLWINSIKMIVRILALKDNINATKYVANGDKYIEMIKSAYKYAKSKYDEIPQNQRVLISEHDAFQYFARAYGFEVKSVLGMNTDTEAGVKTIQELTNYIVEKKVKAIFAETIMNHKSIQALVNSAKNRGWNLIIADKSLYSDALSNDPPTNTYIGIIKYNADVIYEALK